MKAEPAHHVPADVREAIAAFLKGSQKKAQPFAASEAMSAVRRVFPDLDISDSALMDAFVSEASTAAGFRIEADADTADHALRRRSLEVRESEGRATDLLPRTEAQRRIDNGTRRRAKETEDRNGLI